MNELNGSVGNDVIDGRAGDDELEGSRGDDRFVGGEGADSIEFSFSPVAVTVNLEAGTAQAQGASTVTGVENILGGQDKVKVIVSQTANFARDEAVTVFESALAGNNPPAAVPQTVSDEDDESTGPDNDGMTDCGSSCPKMLFTVPRLVCHSASKRGRYAVRATVTLAAEALTCSMAARTVG